MKSDIAYASWQYQIFLMDECYFVVYVQNRIHIL